MAKRQRAVRPGQRKPITRTAAAARPAAPVRPATGLTAAEEARAAEIEAQLVAQEHAAESAALRSRNRRAEELAAPRGRTRDAGVLASRASAEYAYVVSDIRRIVIVAGGLFAFMLVLWVILAVGGAFKI